MHDGSGEIDLPTLVRSCIAGEQGAMLALVDRFRGRVYGLCLRMLGQREDAEDAAQETFVRVLRNLHRWEATRPFEPWLFAIASNRCRTALSDRKRRLPSDTLIEEPADPAPSDHSARLLQEELNLAMATVRDEYREAFCLFHEQHLSYQEIAEVLKVPLGTVKTWVHRARQQLIEQLQKRGAVAEQKHAVS